jgi:hypothetical protein
LSNRNIEIKYDFNQFENVVRILKQGKSKASRQAVAGAFSLSLRKAKQLQFFRNCDDF